MRSKIIFEWIFWILLSVLMFTVGILVALAAPLVVLVAPAPFMLLFRRQGLKEALTGALLGSVIVYVISGPVPAFMYVFTFGLIGIAFGVISKKAKNGIDFILAALTASITVKVILMIVFTRITGVNPFAMTPETAVGVVNSISSALSGSGLSPSQTAIQGYASAMVETVSLLMPSMLILFSAVDTFATYAVVSFVLKKLGSEKLVKLPPFGIWRFPKNIFWALLAALILDFASKSFPDNRVFVVISANLMEVLRGIFMVEGISLCWYYMTRRGIHRALKTVIAVFCLFFPPVSYILSMVGIFDIWYDLRNRIRRK